jgi:ketosteroid isomerase-like protein
MSQENVELVKARFAAFNAGDMEAVHESSDPGIVVAGSRGLA